MKSIDKGMAMIGGANDGLGSRKPASLGRKKYGSDGMPNTSQTNDVLMGPNLN